MAGPWPSPGDPTVAPPPADTPTQLLVLVAPEKRPWAFRAQHPLSRLPPASWGRPLLAGRSALGTCLRNLSGREAKGARKHPACSSSFSLCSLPFFKPLEATSLWPAQTLGLVSIGSLYLPRRTPAPSRAAEAPAITPMLRVPGGCPETGMILKLAGPLFRNWSL